MKRLILTLILSVLSVAVNTALVDRGGGFIYDDVLDITWTQDANINGLDTWDNQIAWAAGLTLGGASRMATAIKAIILEDCRYIGGFKNGDRLKPLPINCPGSSAG